MDKTADGCLVNGKRIFNAFALFLRLKKRQYVVEWVARDV